MPTSTIYWFFANALTRRTMGVLRGRVRQMTSPESVPKELSFRSLDFAWFKIHLILGNRFFNLSSNSWIRSSQLRLSSGSHVLPSSSQPFHSRRYSIFSLQILLSTTSSTSYTYSSSSSFSSTPSTSSGLHIDYVFCYQMRLEFFIEKFPQSGWLCTNREGFLYKLKRLQSHRSTELITYRNFTNI